MPCMNSRGPDCESGAIGQGAKDWLLGQTLAREVGRPIHRKRRVTRGKAAIAPIGTPIDARIPEPLLQPLHRDGFDRKAGSEFFATALFDGA